MTDSTHLSKSLIEQFTQTFNNKKELEYQLALFNSSVENHIKNHHQNFKKALHKNQKDIVEAEIKWGLPDIKEIQRWPDADYNTEMMNFLFGQNSPLPLDYYQALFTQLEKYLNSVKSSPTHIRTHFSDQLQWLLINKPDYFMEKYQKFTFDNWGKIPFSIERHMALHQYVVKNHPNLAISFINASSIHTHTSLAYNIESLYELDDYQQALHQKLKEEQLFKDMAQEGLAQSISHSNFIGINFWLSFHTPFPKKQTCYARFIGEHAKYSSFSDCLSLLADNQSMTIFDHIMLRTAINIQRDTIDFPLVAQILSFYSLSDLHEAEPYFKKYPQMIPLWNKFVFHREMEHQLPIQSETKLVKI